MNKSKWIKLLTASFLFLILVVLILGFIPRSAAYFLISVFALACVCYLFLVQIIKNNQFFLYGIVLAIVMRLALFIFSTLTF
jgi:hypothetical protein